MTRRLRADAAPRRDCWPPLASQAYDAADATLLAPHLSEEVVFVGLVADHVGAARVAHALFAGGERRACKPERALARVTPEAAAPERSYDMVIQSHALWPEQMYLDRVTVRDAKARGTPAHVPSPPRRAPHQALLFRANARSSALRHM